MAQPAGWDTRRLHLDPTFCRAMKRCPGCEAVKFRTEFNNDRRNSDGLSARCKECDRARMREYHKRNKTKNSEYLRRFKEQHPTRAAEYQRKHRYGLSADDFAAMVALQSGQCAICGDEPDRLAVDHNHDTNAVRGLLCRPCNQGLGMFKDNPERLAQAIAYLQHGGTKWPGA